MDIDDPLRKLLETTGWSCDDLLEKLQKIKSSQSSNSDPSSEKSYVEVPSEGKAQSDKCEVDSTEDLSSRKARSRMERRVECRSSEFSDTDEEEAEVLVTNSNIIDEIIEDIFSSDSKESNKSPSTEKGVTDTNQTINDPNNEVLEVTEVKIIELNSDDDDDKFEDECHVVDRFTPEKMEELEKLSRELTYSDDAIHENDSVGETLHRDPLVPIENIRGSESLNISCDKSPNNSIGISGCDSEVEVLEQSNLGAGKQQGCETTTAIVNENPDENIILEEMDQNTQKNLENNENSDSEDTNQENFCSVSSTTDSIEISNSAKEIHKTTSGSKINRIKNITSKELTGVLVNESSIKKGNNLGCEVQSKQKSYDDQVKSVGENEEVPHKLPIRTETDPGPSENSDGFDIAPSSSTIVSSNYTPFLDIAQPNLDVERNLKSQTGPVYETSTKETKEDTIGETAPITSELNVKLSENKDGCDDNSDKGLNNEKPAIFDDIRNNLRMQLSCLRTKKKGSFLGNLNSNSIIDEHSKQALSLSSCLNEKPCKMKFKPTNFLVKSVDDSENDKTRESVSYNCEQERENNDNNKTDFDTKESREPYLNNEATGDTKNTSQNSNQDNNLYTQTNELGFVIMDVQGGIEFDQISRENTNEPKIQPPEMADSTIENFNNSESNEIRNGTEKNDTIGVFDEIRKIIRKQKSNNVSQDTSENLLKTTSNDTFLTSGEDKFTDRNSSVHSSADNSQSSFNFEDSNQNIESNSPFVSNSLDEFLTENAKLNISYNVPKCGAEDGLKETYEESPVVVKKTVEIKETSEELPKKPEQVKAKTLAQKRKLLERQRLREMKKHQRVLTKKVESIKIERRSFIMFENKKLLVETHSQPGKCVAVIDSLNQNLSIQHSNAIKRKLSLLADSKQRKIKYLPGPLSKKPLLQVTGNDEWETVTKNLPKLFLEVSPCIGKSVPPDIRRHLPNECILSNNQIEFALSVMKTKKDENCPVQNFTFPVKYRNDQEQIVVRRRKVIPTSLLPPSSSNHTKEPSDFSEAVKDVIAGLLNYVEVKEISSTLIKDDEDEIREKDIDLKSKSPSLDEKVCVIKKPQKKRSRIDLELQRLSCKVVNVELEEQEEVMCTKLFCKLGCVCKSLKCDYKLNNHCQRYQCMFNCTCPKEEVNEHTILLPANTDLLSNETVNRIEDEAKKNLAKVEREFTQTVIQTNDKTIVVGVGSRHKSRRNTKTPLKYSDFVNDDYPLEKSPDRIISKVNILQHCKVHLTKLNLSQIVPFCMTHNLHDCHCKGESLFIKTNDNTDLIDEAKNENRKKAKSNQFGSKGGSNKSIRRSVNHKTFSSETISDIKRLSGTTKKSKLDETDMDTDSMTCARAKEIDRTYMKNHQPTENLFRLDFAHNIKEADMLRYKLFSKVTKTDGILEVDIFKWNIIKENIHTKKINRKRKQVIEVRDEEPASKYSCIDGAMQRRKKVVTAVKSRPLKIRPFFEGEIVIDDTNMELLAKMGSRHVTDGYARLLPWKNLVEDFHKGKINIWCMKDQTSKLMMNKAEYNNPPKNYIDIRHTTDKTMIILCILGNKLPPGYDYDNVSFILRETKDNYEICGLCAKNINSNSPRVLGVNKTTAECMETNFVHRDMQGAQRTLFMKKEKFKLQELIEEGVKEVGERSIDSKTLHVWAALPEIYRVCKWRVILLNSDFTYLFFKNINYSIKYTDLLNAGIAAKEYGYTVMLKNIEMQNHYDHKLFGIYFDPHHQDRLFVGPYFKPYCGSDIETLRYINGKLVGTESFNKMRGDEEYKCGHWLMEKPNKGNSSLTIDLTEDKEEDILNSTPSKVFIHNNTEVKILDTNPKTPAEFNRYVITNIPHFGYLGAVQHQNAEIDIQWPFEKKLLRFKDTKNAVDFLQKRFSTLLVPIPETFKIAVLLLTSIDLENTHPIESNVLNGHHICGDFGSFNITDLTEENCLEKTGFCKEKIIKAFLYKRQHVFRLRAKQLAGLVGMPENKSCSLQTIVKKANDEIKALNETCRRLVNAKSELLLEKKAKASNVFDLISELPPEQKFIESKKLMSVINSTEPIEVVDSDEEGRQTVAKITDDMSTNHASSSNSSPNSSFKPMIKYPFNRGGTSVLKKRPQEQKASNTSCNKIIQGVKLVQSRDGKLVLVSDTKGQLRKSPLSPGMKVTIKNNKIQSVKRIITDIKPESSNSQTKGNETEDCLRLDTSPPIIDLCADPSV